MKFIYLSRYRNIIKKINGFIGEMNYQKKRRMAHILLYSNVLHEIKKSFIIYNMYYDRPLYQYRSFSNYILNIHNYNLMIINY